MTKLSRNDKIFIGMIIGWIGTVALGFILTAEAANYKYNINKEIGLYEDEVLICNFEGTCKIIPVDNLGTDEGIEQLGMQFNANVDTFTLKSFEVK